MPPLQVEEYLWEVFIEIGLISYTSLTVEAGPTSNMIPILWSEIKGYADMNHGLKGWEALIIRDMSREYIRGIVAGESPHAKPPWDEAKLVLVRRVRRKSR